jgi:hypothetical protein
MIPFDTRKKKQRASVPLNLNNKRPVVLSDFEVREPRIMTSQSFSTIDRIPRRQMCRDGLDREHLARLKPFVHRVLADFAFRISMKASFMRPLQSLYIPQAYLSSSLSL